LGKDLRRSEKKKRPQEWGKGKKREGGKKPKGEGGESFLDDYRDDQGNTVDERKMGKGGGRGKGEKRKKKTYYYLNIERGRERKGEEKYRVPLSSREESRKKSERKRRGGEKKERKSLCAGGKKSSKIGTRKKKGKQREKKGRKLLPKGKKKKKESFDVECDRREGEKKREGGGHNRMGNQPEEGRGGDSLEGCRASVGAAGKRGKRKGGKKRKGGEGYKNLTCPMGGGEGNGFFAQPNDGGRRCRKKKG